MHSTHERQKVLLEGDRLGVASSRDLFVAAHVIMPCQSFGGQMIASIGRHRPIVFDADAGKERGHLRDERIVPSRYFDDLPLDRDFVRPQPKFLALAGDEGTKHQRRAVTIEATRLRELVVFRDLPKTVVALDGPIEHQPTDIMLVIRHFICVAKHCGRAHLLQPVYDLR